MSSEWPPELCTAAQTRALERLVMEQQGVASLALMQRAGRAAFDLLTTRYHAAKKPVVICGGGNNAGDGYALACLALAANIDIWVVALVEPASLKGDAAHCAAEFLRAGGGDRLVSAAALADADLVIDALLGSGLNRAVAGVFAELIDQVNALSCPTLALDMPSGLNADTGCAMGAAIRAEATLCFISLKRGQFTASGPELCGTILFDALGAPAGLHSQLETNARLLSDAATPLPLPRRSLDSHKGDYGHVLVVGGERGYLGAALLAGSAAARCGAGLVTVATRPEHASHIALFRPELMTLALSAPQDLDARLAAVDAVAIGPGLGQSEWAEALLARTLRTRLPLVVDADALNLLTREHKRRENWVLTPHPGEAARLLEGAATTVQTDRFAAIDALQERFGGTIVLKGNGSLIKSGKGPVGVNRSGNPGMASGGMGDVLTGLIAGLLAQGLSAAAAATAGVRIHGQAADRCAAMGERGMLAADLLPAIRILNNQN